jgi:hypothetical protein
MPFIRMHMSLVAGAALPALLVAYSVCAAWLPRYLVDPPAYDALYLTQYNESSPNSARFQVMDGRFSLHFSGENFGYGWPRLYRFSPAAGTLSEIPVTAPASLPVMPPYNRPVLPASEEKTTSVPIPELDGVRVDPSRVAPDGYVFTPGYEKRPSLLSRWLVSQRAYDLAVVEKYGYAVALPNPDREGANQSLRFAGWIVP